MTVAQRDSAEAYVIEHVCNVLGVRREDLISVQHEPMQDRYGVVFKIPPPSRAVLDAATKVRRHFTDSLRAEVIRAAVPELAVDLDQLLSMICSPEVQRKIIWFDGHAVRARVL